MGVKIRDSVTVNLRDELGRKHCLTCDTWLTLDRFYKCKHTSDYMQPKCIDCTKWSNAFRLFGITKTRYFSLLSEQGNACAICKTPAPGNPLDRRFAIDHDRSCCPGDKTCGLCVRGILCSACNKGLGFARDSTLILGNMIKYLSERNVNDRS